MIMPGDKTIRFFDVESGEERLRRQGGGGVSAVAACAPDGKSAATACADGTIRVWETATGRELLSVKGGVGEVLTLTYSPDGARIAS